MKRISALFLLLAAIFVAPLASKAETRYAPIVSVSINDLEFKQDLFPVSKMVGFQVGIMGEKMFPGIGFGIDYSLLYNQMGAKTDLGDRRIWSSDGFGENFTRLHMLQIPIHLRFKWTRMNGIEDYIAPFIYGGPDFGIMIGHNKIKGNEGVAEPYTYSGGDLGLTAGGGFEILRRWQVSVQYTWGMTYLLKTSKLENVSAKNRQLSFRVAYMF